LLLRLGTTIATVSPVGKACQLTQFKYKVDARVECSNLPQEHLAKDEPKI